MNDSLQPGFSVTGHCDGRSPLVLASPHSGRDYPPAFLAAARLSLMQLRRTEDGLVDQLLDGIACAPVLRARFARTYLDLNRAADELDPAMFDAPLAIPVRITDRVTAGLGVVPRLAAHGQDIYGRKLAPADAARRVTSLHLPWHRAIADCLDRARRRHGHAILIDCHSMPTPVGIRPPQIVLGDRHGTTAAPALVRLVERHFGSFGWRVARNTPYAGGHTTQTHGDLTAGVHAIQIEIDRSLYMDGASLHPGPGFGRVAEAMHGLARLIVATAPILRLDPPRREAAE
ncbi:N-formylglutamate amidohydrolase [Polymorphobacter fuscus]|uniref:N-formylglutamate amidohydrolase n=1 Tax=Sandarakinorhabdus fusca TaxID=1439888 RepID=A0A7C9GPL1_9SPHN|nr:N-formylglutamate amidohydrolase [Polymorphobacter fuscus]KAB7646385.1 N-formylglutamate amidohydrolase [Polymorphobacter fuscus]MQT17615.1 N-formylglutamate amidohydrolase [Polymorphobacter fuscus]NJC09842.1 N-formylglutamate deformylase [Polymorphobacter fuscus]